MTILLQYYSIDVLFFHLFINSLQFVNIKSIRFIIFGRVQVLVDDSVHD